MTLDKVKRGQSFTISLISSESVRSQAIRFGIVTGEFVTCEEVIPAGPIVVRKNRQLIALGPWNKECSRKEATIMWFSTWVIAFLIGGIVAQTVRLLGDGETSLGALLVAGVVG